MKETSEPIIINRSDTLIGTLDHESMVHMSSFRIQAGQ